MILEMLHLILYIRISALPCILYDCILDNNLRRVLYNIVHRQLLNNAISFNISYF